MSSLDISNFRRKKALEKRLREKFWWGWSTGSITSKRARTGERPKPI